MCLWRFIQLKISTKDPTTLSDGRVFCLNCVGFEVFLGEYSVVEA